MMDNSNRTSIGNICTNCNKANDIKANFCVYCGTSLPNEITHEDTTTEKFCTNCKKYNDKDADFCVYCGSPLFSHEDEEYTMVLSPDDIPEDDDCTTILAPPEPEKIPILLNEDLGLEAKVIKLPFIIGRKKNFADFYIDGNTAISRKHAEINKENEMYTIRDLDSKNMTYINDEQLDPYEYKELNDGDRIKVADIEIVFKIVEQPDL